MWTVVPRELVPLSAADRPHWPPGGAHLPRSRAPRAAERALSPQTLPAFDSVDSGSPACTFSRRVRAFAALPWRGEKTASHAQRCQRAGTAPAPRELSPPRCISMRLSTRGGSSRGSVAFDPPSKRRRRLDKRRAVPAPSGDVSTRTSWSCRASACCNCAERRVLHLSCATGAASLPSVSAPRKCPSDVGQQRQRTTQGTATSGFCGQRLM